MTAAAEWIPAPRRGYPVHLVAACPLSRPPAVLSAVSLTASEGRRVEAAGSERRRRELVIGRRWLRHVAGLASGQPAGAVSVAWPDGPRLSGTLSGYGASLAHSRGYVLAALSSGGAVGVDVEDRVPRPRWRHLAEAFLCRSDHEFIDAAGTAPTAETPAFTRFLAVWTAREAFAKSMRGSVLDDLSRPLLEPVDAGAILQDGVRIDVYVDPRKVVAVCSTGGGAVFGLAADGRRIVIRPRHVFLVRDHATAAAG